ncbi:MULTISPECIES: hypothetical protein [Veillonella]|uniref:hypothetical protein n=1 Tax=Veillonella TaxID=29465 RepID=UPI0029124A4B|nr:hypothetical protein [Veillonella sp.]MDU4114851.1 hypothetical protein [Veillonella sp.]MDU5295879.1 hypothetical protein [Veillonella sp.]MDU5870506.1 hypothetical protein [Veillonella sp.]
MFLCEQSIKRLRIIINGDNTDDYRSGPDLVSFFNKLGFNDCYGQGFPSRWIFTELKLNEINGTTKLESCIKSIFAVNNYIGRIDYLDNLIDEFNQYLAFDKLKIFRENEKILIGKIDKIIIPRIKEQSDISEKEFLQLAFDTSIDDIGLDYNITEILKIRIGEAESNIKVGCSLSAIILIGSVAEGILLGVATKYPRDFNTVNRAPTNRNDGKVKPFNAWTLNDFIESAYELDIIHEDVKKFSHVLREFRNYIHPYQQLCSKFSPNIHTAAICLQVLKALITQVSEYVRKV